VQLTCGSRFAAAVCVVPHPACRWQTLLKPAAGGWGAAVLCGWEANSQRKREEGQERGSTSPAAADTPRDRISCGNPHRGAASRSDRYQRCMAPGILQLRAPLALVLGAASSASAHKSPLLLPSSSSTDIAACVCSAIGCRAGAMAVAAVAAWRMGKEMVWWSQICTFPLDRFCRAGRGDLHLYDG